MLIESISAKAARVSDTEERKRPLSFLLGGPCALTATISPQRNTRTDSVLSRCVGVILRP